MFSIKPVSEFLTNLSPSINLYGCTAIEILFLRSNGEQIDDVVWLRQSVSEILLI